MKKTQEKSTIQTATKDFVKKRNRRRISVILSLCLAVCAVVGVAYGVRHSGSAWNHITKEIVCEETVNLHQHTDDCFGFEDGNEIHICGYADYLVHTHNQYCFNDDNELICPLPEVEEHVHDDSCYEEVKVLVCELEETEEIFDDEIIEDEIIDDEEILDDEIVEDEIIDDEIVEDEIIDDEIIEDEIIDDDLMIIEDEEAPLAATPHVHDESCYEIKKVLVCGQLELHTHDDDCYDEYGNLICGQLELKEHQHTEDCVIKRELTEEEIEALDKADPNAKTNLAEQIFTKTVETDEYIVTVTYNGLAEIPEEAELVVKEVELTDAQLEAVAEETGTEIVSEKAETETNEASEETSEDKPVASLYKSLDICFMLDGVEIEPKAEVTVDVQFLDDEFEQEEMTITHIKDDGSAEVLGTQDIDEYSNINFATDSFSIYTFTKASKGTSNLANGTYAGYFEYKTNDTQNAFLTDEYARYRNDRGAMGAVASSFHIVAFDTAKLNVHTNGNVLCKNLYTNTNNWGTHSKNYAIPEVSYIQNSAHIGNLPEEGRGTGKDGQPAERVLAVGSNVYTESNNEKNYLKVSDNNITAWQAAKYVVKDKDTASAPFIDLGQVYQEVKEISANLASQGDINTVADFRDQNNRSIRLTDPDSAGYYNMTAQQLNDISGTPIRFTGFETYDGSGNYVGNAKQGAIIVNVNCKGYSGWLKLPQETKVIFDGKKEVDRAEVVEFSGGKVIWNFYNIGNGLTIDGSQVCGIILAPDADIRINNGNGNFIGKNVEINGESHRTDFTGTTVPFAAQLTATKTVDGRTPLANEKFDFTLFEIVNGAPVKIQTVKNDGSNISFDKISYSKDSDVGDHWYFIKEDELNNSRYTRDDVAYIIKTTVTKSGNKYNATSQYFRTTYSKIEEVKNITIDSMLQDNVDESKLLFNNLDATSISVEKKWVAEDGQTELKENIPDSITVKLMQSVNGSDKQYGDEITLTKGNKFAYKWDSLPRQDEKGNAYSYYVVENPVEGFDQIINGDPVKLTEGTITLTNAKKPEKVSIHIKKKYYLVENDTTLKDQSKRLIDPSVEVTDPTLFRPGTKYPEAWEVMATLYVSPNGGQSWDQCWPEIVLGDNYENLPDDQKIHYTTSTGETGIQKRKKASFDIHQADNWEITITGLPKSGIFNGDLGGYHGKYVDFTYKVLERQSCWSIYQYDYDNYTLNGVKKPLDNGGNVFNPDMIGGDTGYEPIVTGGLTKDGPTTYDFTLNNFGGGYVDLEILKNWWTVEGGVDSIQNGANDDAFLTLELTEKVTGKKIANYRMTKDTLVEVDDSGNPVGKPQYVTEALTNNHNLWSGKIKDLNKYVIKNGKLMFADYDITEKVVREEGENKFVYGSYVCTNVNITKNSEDPKEWKITTFTLDNKNTESYELPKTGGHGTLGGFIKMWMRKFF